MDIDEPQKKTLRGIGHSLKPVIMIGDNGLSDSLFAEFRATLAHHELIKVKVRVGNRKLRDGIIKELCEKADAVLVQRVGNVALIYRQNPDEPKIRLQSAR